MCARSASWVRKLELHWHKEDFGIYTVQAWVGYFGLDDPLSLVGSI